MENGGPGDPSLFEVVGAGRGASPGRVDGLGRDLGLSFPTGAGGRKWPEPWRVPSAGGGLGRGRGSLPLRPLELSYVLLEVPFRLNTRLHFAVI